MKYILALVLFVFISCINKVPIENLKFLNGYWEIENVTFPSGGDKDYTINETIDYFELINNNGFRKKVMPQFDGKYLVNNAFEKINLKHIDDKYFIEYKTDYANWKEEIIEISKEKLVLKNDSNVVYKYKKSIAFSLK